MDQNDFSGLQDSNMRGTDSESVRKQDIGDRVRDLGRHCVK